MVLKSCGELGKREDRNGYQNPYAYEKEN